MVSTGWQGATSGDWLWLYFALTLGLVGAVYRAVRRRSSPAERLRREWAREHGWVAEEEADARSMAFATSLLGGPRPGRHRRLADEVLTYRRGSRSSCTPSRYRWQPAGDDPRELVPSRGEGVGAYSAHVVAVPLHRDVPMVQVTPQGAASTFASRGRRPGPAVRVARVQRGVPGRHRRPPDRPRGPAPAAHGATCWRARPERVVADRPRLDLRVGRRSHAGAADPARCSTWSARSVPRSRRSSAPRSTPPARYPDRRDPRPLPDAPRAAARPHPDPRGRAREGHAVVGP